MHAQVPINTPFQARSLNVAASNLLEGPPLLSLTERAEQTCSIHGCDKFYRHPVSSHVQKCTTTPNHGWICRLQSSKKLMYTMVFPPTWWRGRTFETSITDPCCSCTICIYVSMRESPWYQWPPDCSLNGRPCSFWKVVQPTANHSSMLPVGDGLSRLQESLQTLAWPHGRMAPTLAPG